MTAARKRTAIIGAGPCGLAALKETLEAGHDATLFERTSLLGGVFASSSIYPNLHLTISNWAMAFSDFPDDARLQYPTAEHYLRYLKRYATHFGLESHIRYNKEVKRAEQNADGQWNLTTLTNNKREEQHTFDALIVATGANQVPKPIPASLKNFTGQTIHSTEYNDIFKQEAEKKRLRILVVGGGESGADISADLSTLTPHVTVWLRRRMCVGPRYLNLRAEMEQVEENKTTDYPANGFLEAVTTNRLSAGQNVYTYGLFRRLLFLLPMMGFPVLNETLSSWGHESTVSAWMMTDQATYVTKNQRMVEAEHEGKIEVVVTPDVSVQGQEVRFAMPDGSVQRQTFDVVVNCTGFTTSFLWLHLSGNNKLNTNPRSWWLHCVPPSSKLNHSNNLFFVGYARPHQGGIPVMAEMLSRYTAKLLSGEKQLPSNHAELAKQDAIAECEYYHLSPDLNTLVDYNAFLESVARKIGCEPRLPVACVLAYNLHVVASLALALSFSMLEPKFLDVNTACLVYFLSILPFFALYNGILIKWLFYPNWSAWYRQRGPGSNPGFFKFVLDRVSIWTATAITRGFVLVLLWSIPTMYLQYVVSFPLFVVDKTLLALGLRFGRKMGGLLRPKLFVLHGVEWTWQDLFLP